MEINYRRQIGWLNPELVDMPKINIIGAGGIGSYVAFALAQMGITDITIWDRDSVEEHNLPNQLFLLEHLGWKKVDAVKDMILKKTGHAIETKNRFFRDGSKIHNGMVILATDNIDSRVTTYNSVKETGVSRVIDGRLGGLSYQVFNVDMNNERAKKRYEQTFFPENETVELPCTEKSICDIAFSISGEMSRQTRLAIMNPKKCTPAFEVDYQNHMYVIGDSACMY